jgi:serine/threonine-protein kinase RsbW
MKEKTITIKNQLEQITLLAEELEILAETWDIPMEMMLSMNLVLEELITNIIFYGYEDTLEHSIHIRFAVDQTMLKIQLEDDAKAFDPLQAPEPKLDQPIEERKIGGLGIHLVRSIMDEVSYQRIDNKNILSMVKDMATC